MSYPSTSPYYVTNVVNNLFLDVMSSRYVTPKNSDALWEIAPTYNLRPDLLAQDLYDDSRLWWVFAQRNPDILADPFFDFVTGTKIYIPLLTTLRADLGI